MTTDGDQQWWMATNGRWYRRSTSSGVPDDQTIPDGTLPPPEGEAGFPSRPNSRPDRISTTSMNTGAWKPVHAPRQRYGQGIAGTIDLARSCAWFVIGAAAIYAVAGMLAFAYFLVAGPDQVVFTPTGRGGLQTTPWWEMRVLFAGATALATLWLVGLLVGLYGLLRLQSEMLWQTTR